MILNFFMRLLEIVIFVTLSVVSLLALVLIVSAFRAGLWIISVLIAGGLATVWYLALSMIKEGK